LQKLDTSNSKVNAKIDSVQSKFQNASTLQIGGLLRTKWPQDSVRESKANRNELDSLKQRLAVKIDSLQANGMSATSLRAKLDSIERKIDANRFYEVQSKLHEMESKLNKPIVDAEDAVNEKLNLMRSEGGANANLPGTVTAPELETTLTSISTEVNIPVLSDTGIPLQEDVKGVEGLSSKLSDLQDIPQQQLDKMNSVNGVEQVQSGLEKANDMTDKVQSYGSDVKSMAQGDFENVNELPATLEEEAMKINELTELQDQTGTLDNYRSLAEKAKDPNALMEEVKQQGFTYAVDHFAGKEEILQKAMEHMDKLKVKYKELDNLRDLPKRKPNEMKGKSLNERLVRGVTLQIQKSNNFWLDYNPYLGYRLYGRFTAGVGWNERVSIDNDLNFSLRDRIYGPRVFVDFAYRKGWSVRADIEKMNARAEVPQINQTGESNRQWLWSAFVGIRKEYKFSKRATGNFEFLYNVYDDKNQSPYSSRLAVRFGFEISGKRAQQSSEK